MSEATVTGVVHVIEPTKTFGKNNFRKRVVVLEQEKGRFTNYIPLEFVHESCDTVDQLNVGDEVEVAYRLSGRKWQRDPNSEVKYFLNAEASSYKVIKAKGGAAPADDSIASANDAFMEAAEDSDDVPF